VSCWFSTRSWLEQNRARKDRIVSAIYDTARWANAHQAQTLAILARTLRSIPICCAVCPSGLRDGDHAATLQPMLNIGFTEKLIPAIDAGTLLRA